MFSEVRWTRSDCGDHCAASSSVKGTDNGRPLACQCGNCHNINDKVRTTNVTKMSLTIERDDLFTEINEANRHSADDTVAQRGHRDPGTASVTRHTNSNNCHKHSRLKTTHNRQHQQRDSLHFSNFLYSWLNDSSTRSIGAQQQQHQDDMPCGSSRRKGAPTTSAHKSIFYQLVVYLILNVVCNSLLITSVRGDDDLSLRSDVGAPGPAVDDDEWQREQHYTPTWAVHIPGGEHVARQVADDHGYVILGKVSGYIQFSFCCLIYMTVYITNEISI